LCDENNEKENGKWSGYCFDLNNGKHGILNIVLDSPVGTR
jgi:hypothetical protein